MDISSTDVSTAEDLNDQCKFTFFITLNIARKLIFLNNLENLLCFVRSNITISNEVWATAHIQQAVMTSG